MGVIKKRHFRAVGCLTAKRQSTFIMVGMPQTNHQRPERYLSENCVQRFADSALKEVKSYQRID